MSRSNTTTPAPAFLALSCVGFIASAAPALAQSASGPVDEGQLGSMAVTAAAIDDTIKVERVESPKATRPLLDTPQTITVISNQTLSKQNLLTLRDALATLPGITFGAGEGGGGYGDSINLRGQSANTDIQIDGVRDSAQYSRSDTFNLEQIEVVNGANSVFGGSGSISGSINLITKRPKADDLTVVQGGIGTDNYYRATVDSNVRVSDLVAVRLNAMAHKNDVPGRDVDQYERWGIAPSVTIGIDGPTSLTFLYVHQEDDNTPLYGVPYYASLGGLLPGADYGGYYGYRNIDYQKQTVDQATLIFDHAFSDAVSVRNLTRWQRVEQDLVLNPPQGTYCLANGQTTAGVACTTPGIYQPSGPRGTARFSENQTLFNQTDLRAVFDTGGLEHTITLGMSLLREDYDLINGNVLRNPGGATPNPALPPINIANPDTLYAGPVNFIQSGTQEGTLSNVAFYLFDAIALSEQFEINAGVRWERNKADFRSDTLATPASGGAFTEGVTQSTSDSLFSYRVGLVYKPVPNASLYAAYGNSRNPTATTVRSGCGLATALNLFNDPCIANPEEAVNYEIGGKIDLFDNGLQLTAALFRNERTNYRVASNDPLIGTLPVNDGRNRVDGIALGASGRVGDFTIFANYTYLDSEVLQSLSDFQKEAGVVDLQKGNQLINTPRHSGSLFATYTLPFGLQLGYGLTYQGSFLLNNAAAPNFRSDDWLTHRAMLSYPVTDGLTAQLNVQNVTDEKYYTAIRNNGWALPGEARSAVLSLFYSF